MKASHVVLLAAGITMTFCACAKAAECVDEAEIRRLAGKAEKCEALSADEAKTLADAMGVKAREMRFVVIDAETKAPIGGAFVKGEGMATSELPAHRQLPGKTTMPLAFEMTATKDGKANFTVFGASSVDNVIVIAIADGYDNTSYRLGSIDFGKIYYLVMEKAASL